MRIVTIGVIALGWFVSGMLIGQTKPAQEVDKTDMMLAEAERAQIDELLTNWHNAASRADYDGYFNPLDEHAVYLGTDATERWTKSEFSTFCKPHFARKNGWSFKAVSRHIMFDSPTGHQKTAVASLSKNPNSSDGKSQQKRETQARDRPSKQNQLRREMQVPPNQQAFRRRIPLA